MWFCGVDFMAIFSNMSILAISCDPDQIWKKGLQILNLLQNSTLIPGWTTPFGAHYLVAIFRNPIILGAVGQIWPNRLQIWILLKNWGRVPSWTGKIWWCIPILKKCTKTILKIAGVTDWISNFWLQIWILLRKWVQMIYRTSYLGKIKICKTAS